MSENRTIVFGKGMTFDPACSKCGRFVRSFKRVRVDSDGQPKGPNAHCRKCGRTQMLFLGYY